MTKDKWHELEQQASKDACTRGFSIELSPENWQQAKENYLTFIKEVDEATEVYFMENKERK